ncbi:ShlB/FhaC/HecB family hemolysin secretion/activation protein [Paraburkholderia phenoliruptrix]|uniref:ShlB/FhaC/HecB family hemolysin secretion/activation protein n=1 Tax=Paraburkholderia phenoliruptrix TaxID=252970 RepID=UPI002869B9DB|nr:ShlB/FhaC/HecB family hemolysin secretion/activation protein [Paraburkholderia phenoliruptrix]WMY08746.1 ShlB/FhaC/HecB family hemolysin secretion/activation protein [Paraburkholderia phenoliruptrix]
MLWRKNEVNRQIAHAMWVLPVLMAGAAHAEPVATVSSSLPAAQAAVSFKVIPAGSRDEAAMLKLLRDTAATLGSAPATLEDINRWSDRLTVALRQGGFPVAHVLMTDANWRAAQKGAQPVFAVFPGRIGKIAVQNKSRVDDAGLQRLVTHAMCGNDSAADACVLNMPRLERATQLLQDLPGVAIEKAPQFSPGAGVGDIDVVFSIAEKGKPMQADLILDNQGIESTGAYRFGVTASGNNYFGAGESYAFTLLSTDKKMWTGSLTGSVPIFDDGLRMTGGITRQQYSINAGTPVAGVATTGQAGVVYPFLRGLDASVWGGASLLHSQAATTYKDYGFATHSTLDSVRLSVQADNGDRPQQLRTNILSGQAALTLGHQRNDDAALDAGPQRAGNYAKLTGFGFGTYALTRSGNLFLTGRVNSQLASRNLDASEKLAAGGPDAVRAYRADEVSFDEGVVINAGLYQRFPIATGHQLQLGVFSDFAIGRVNHSPWKDWEKSYVGVPGVTNTRTLAGYGASVDWLTPVGATVSASVSKPYGFSSASWVEPGKKPLQYWMSVTWKH